MRRKGLGVAAISYDSEQILADYSKRNGITFPLLSDPGSATIRRYGILNTVAEEGLVSQGKDPALTADIERYVTVTELTERFRGIPFPGTFVLDAQGRVTSRFFEDYYRERSTASTLLLKLGDAGTAVQATQVSTDYLDLKTYPSDPAIAFGNRASLVLDFTPKPRIHVYAPGASGYRVIKLTMTPEPFVRTLPMQYPASEIYFFAPLNERVPVYQRPFTLLQEVVLEATPQAQEALKGRDKLTLTGTLEYQACDDKTCFNPTSVPLSWTLEVRPFVPGARRGAGRGGR